MKPTVGRIVHYFERDNKHPDRKIVPRAAMITAVIGDLGLPDTVMLALIEKTRKSRVEIEQAVMLTVFFPGANPAPMLDPVFQGTERGYWNWPEIKTEAKPQEDKWPGAE